MIVRSCTRHMIDRFLVLAADTDTLVVVAILAVRLIVPLFIPRFPLPAILICLVVDAADQTILQKATDFNLDRYQSFDKALDIYYLAVAYLTVFRNWTNGFGIIVAAFLWYYRLVGVLLFEILGYRWLLLVFPNTFEYFFIAYCVIQTRWNPLRVTNRGMIGLAAFIWIFIKLPQEWWIHVAQLDFTDFMKETVFGVDADSSWSDAFSNRPGVLLAIVAVIVGLAVAGWLLRKRLPTADWSFGLDMNRTDAVVRRAEPIPTSMPRRCDREGRFDRAGRRNLRIGPRGGVERVADRRCDGAGRPRECRPEYRARSAGDRMGVTGAGVHRARSSEHAAAERLRLAGWRR